MPTYEFRCPDGHEFERFYKTISTAPSEAQCPECGAVSGRMMSAGAGFAFKGSGFYLTDYGKNAHRGSAPEKKGDESSAAAKNEGAPSTADTASKAESTTKAGGPAKAESSQKSDSGKSNSESAKSKSESAKSKSESAKSKASKPKSE